LKSKLMKSKTSYSSAQAAKAQLTRELQMRGAQVALAAIRQFGEQGIRQILAKPTAQHGALRAFLFSPAAAEALKRLSD
jgi:hypothetical protein